VTDATTTADAGRTCGPGHERLADELRAVALLALDRLDPLLARLRDGVRAAPPHDGATSCPLCAALAAVRVDRPDLAGRLAEHATGLVTALRDALAETGPGTPEPAPVPPTTRRVQHIPVHRTAGDAPC
jgi:hypothetical protein